jgi:hypothetical protein
VESECITLSQGLCTPKMLGPEVLMAGGMGGKILDRREKDHSQ